MEAISVLTLLAGIILLGFLAQWIAWSSGLPSIVFLFAGGLLVGPVSGLVSPDALFGNLLFPVVSALIGIILFEGGLTLEFDELEDQGGPVVRLIVIGSMVTFFLTTVCSHFILGLPLLISSLLGAILVVTGPTVVIPLLHQIRPEGDVGSVARWEGIIIDPIGAIMAVVVFELILAGTAGATSGVILGLLKFTKAIAIGTAIGLFAAYVLTLLFDRYWIPDFLHNMAILSVVLTAQALSNQIAHESGLMAVTIMGIYLANQKRIAVRHILHFKEDLRVLFISILFVVLVARLDMSFLTEIQTDQLMFLGALILLVRPMAVLTSTVGTELSWPDRAFLSWLAPRGIVAAAVASLFAEELEHVGVTGAGQLDEITFFVIAGTVLVYGLTLDPISKLLGISDEEPQGILFVGASGWVQSLASELKKHDVLVRLADKNQHRIHKSRRNGLDAHPVDVLTESEFQAMNIQGLGYCLSVTANNEVNTIASIHALDMGFNRSQVFQLPTDDQETIDQEQPDPHKGRPLFDENATSSELHEKFNSGWYISSQTFATDADHEDLRARPSESYIPLVILRESGDVDIVTVETELDPSAGDTLFLLESNRNTSSEH